jgi:hypothetical protein
MGFMLSLKLTTDQYFQRVELVRVGGRTYFGKKYLATGFYHFLVKNHDLNTVVLENGWLTKNEYLL